MLHAPNKSDYRPFETESCPLPNSPASNRGVWGVMGRRCVRLEGDDVASEGPDCPDCRRLGIHVVQRPVCPDPWTTIIPGRSRSAKRLILRGLPGAVQIHRCRGWAPAYDSA